MTDRFLRCQMDNDQYVPIRIIAGFPKVKRLTSDYNLVVKVLRGISFFDLFCYAEIYSGIFENMEECTSCRKPIVCYGNGSITLRFLWFYHYQTV